VGNAISEELKSPKYKGKPTRTRRRYRRAYLDRGYEIWKALQIRQGRRFMENDAKNPVMITNQITAPGYYFKEILTIKEAAAYIGVTVEGMYQYIHNRKIPCYKPLGSGGKSYFKKSEMDNFMLRNKRNADYEVSKKADDMLNGEAR
jgi:excisionase family DNA binding protein